MLTGWKKENFNKMLRENGVSKKPPTRSLVDLGKTVNRLQTEK